MYINGSPDRQSGLGSRNFERKRCVWRYLPHINVDRSKVSSFRSCTGIVRSIFAVIFIFLLLPVYFLVTGILFLSLRCRPRVIVFFLQHDEIYGPSLMTKFHYHDSCTIKLQSISKWVLVWISKIQVSVMYQSMFSIGLNKPSLSSDHSPIVR